MTDFQISCANCGHSYENGGFLECRRNPPVADPHGKPDDMALFPIVEWNWWCGRHTEVLYAEPAYRARLLESRKIRMLDWFDRTFEEEEFDKLRAIFTLNGEESEQNEECIRALFQSGWLEKRFDEEGVLKWRITDAGLEALENDPWMNGSPEGSP